MRIKKPSTLLSGISIEKLLHMYGQYAIAQFYMRWQQCVYMHAVLSSHSLWSGTKPWPGRSSRWTLLPPAWISSIARVCVMPWVASPLISTIWSPTCDADVTSRQVFSEFTKRVCSVTALLSKIGFFQTMRWKIVKHFTLSTRSAVGSCSRGCDTQLMEAFTVSNHITPNCCDVRHKL